jgi:hypothetical protein
MLKQDVELAKLLMEKSNGLLSRARELQAELDGVEDRLLEARSLKDERGAYEEVLLRAAELLGREDLKVASPETDDLEEHAELLKEDLDKVLGESSEYARLLSTLRERAPQILRAAGGDVDEPVPGAAAASNGAGGGASPVLAGGPLPAIDQARFNANGDEAAILSHFNLAAIQSKAGSAGLAVILDCSSVIERVPFYDRHRLAQDEAGSRDTLVKDIAVLGSQVQCGFHLIFNGPHKSSVPVGGNILIEDAGGGDDAREQVSARVAELVSVYNHQGIPVAVVTGSPGLAETARQGGAQAFQLAEFFMT